METVTIKITVGEMTKIIECTVVEFKLAPLLDALEATVDIYKFE